jgi:glycosyltransferase involved in cell wall biosynthesis
MNKQLSVIIPYWSNPESLEKIIISVNELNPLEILIIVQEGCNEITRLDKRLRWSPIYRSKSHTDNDRQQLGAQVAKGDLLLFLDGDMPLSSDQLSEFTNPIIMGNADVILSSLDHHLRQKLPMSPYMVWCQTINEICDRSELKTTTLATLPYAISKKVMNTLDDDTLTNPYLFHINVIEQGHTIHRSNIIDHIPIDKIRPFHSNNQTDFTPFLQAVKAWQKINGVRGGYSNGGKRLDILEGLKSKKEYPVHKRGNGTTSKLYYGKQLSIIIPAQNEALSIGKVISEARKLEPLEIIIVVNGSTDRTATIATSLGATVIEYPERLGHNVGRSIGALEARGDILLFIDSDFAIPATELQPFANAVAEGIDVALNNLNPFLTFQYPIHNVSLIKYAFNMICNQKELGIGSLVAVPHAISRACLEQVGFEFLVCPSLAQAKALSKGFNIACVHTVNVMRPNRIRPEQHLGYHSDGGNKEDVIQKILNHRDIGLYREKIKQSPTITQGWGMKSSHFNGKQLSVIIPAQNHSQVIEDAIRETRKIAPLEIIVVISNSTDRTKEIARKLGTTIIEYKEPLTIDTAFAIGAIAAKGDLVYFIDPTKKSRPTAELRILGDHLEALSYVLKHKGIDNK